MRDAPIGSHRPTTTCKTGREIEELRRGTQLQFKNMMKFRDNPFPQNEVSWLRRSTRGA